MFSKKSLKAKDTKSTEVEPWKKENHVHTAFKNVSRTFSLINVFLSFNNSLSVALLPNGGIIFPEFFECLTSNKDYRSILSSTKSTQHKFFKRSIQNLMDKYINFIPNQSTENHKLIFHKKEAIFSQELISVDSAQNSKLDELKILKDKLTKKNENLKVGRKTNFISKRKIFGRAKYQLKNFGVSKIKQRKFNYSSMRTKFISEGKNQKIIRMKLISQSSVDSEDNFIIFSKESVCESEGEEEIEFKEKKRLKKRDNPIPENSTNDKKIDCETNKKLDRPRLSSECSINSEDSFIVFQEDSESVKETESDVESDCTTETETESEFEDNLSQRKVRFNLIPTIHIIDCEPCVPFARWMEEMRRFRERIRETGLILQPILNFDHRAEICKKIFLNGD